MTVAIGVLDTTNGDTQSAPSAHVSSESDDCTVIVESPAASTSDVPERPVPESDNLNGEPADTQAQADSPKYRRAKFLCTYRVLVVDADDEDDAFEQARGAVADAGRASWDIEESSGEGEAIPL